MTPELKAKELVDKFEAIDNPSWDGEYQEWNDVPLQKDTAKQCALILCDEILNVIAKNGVIRPHTEYENEKEYWNMVKQNIELL